MTKMKRMRSIIFGIRNKPLFFSGLLVLISGGVLFAQATQPNFKFEAEQGTLTGNVETVSDPNASGGSSVAFTEYIPPASGMFSDTFSSLSNWSFAHMAIEAPAHQDSGSSVSVVNGAARIVTADQNYGDASIRSNRLYDVRTGGTFTMDVSFGDGNLPATGAPIGWPYVEFTDQPVNVPAIKDHNGQFLGHYGL